nr:RNA-directed DNA polymerase, eukaryota, reverse transcriptase zinc-binding domain protein [Tanacetum cinerariifolium]
MFTLLPNGDTISVLSHAKTPNLDFSAPDGDNVRLSSLTRRISLSHVDQNVTSTFTSYEELTNPNLETMNPSKNPSMAGENMNWSINMHNTQYPKPFKSIWNVVEANLNPSGPMDPSNSSFIVQSVDINTNSTSNIGVAGAGTKDQTNVKSNFRSLVADKVFDGVNIFIPRKVVEKERSSFARCLIEINSEADFMNSVTISIPDLDGPGVLMSKGFQVGKEFAFQPRASNAGYNGYTGTNDRQQYMGKKKISNIASLDPFAALGVDNDEEKESNLVGHARLIRNRSWVLLGDSNAALNLKDHSVGDYEPNAAMREFKKCVQAMEVAGVSCTGLYFTWNQKPKGSNGILKKIDRIM